GFRFYFTPLPGCFSPFPHGTDSLSVTKEYFALGDGHPVFQRNSSCSVVLRIHSKLIHLSTTGLLPPTVGLPRPFVQMSQSVVNVLQPQQMLVWALPVS